MPAYICERCGCVDNTACGGNYWAVKTMREPFKEDYANKLLLCAECTPSTFKDGSPKTDAGKWHNRFPKKHWSEYGTKEFLLKENGLENVKEYFEKYDGDLVL